VKGGGGGGGGGGGVRGVVGGGLFWMNVNDHSSLSEASS
jgi:hypothetical protein